MEGGIERVVEIREGRRTRWRCRLGGWGMLDGVKGGSEEEQDGGSKGGSGGGNGVGTCGGCGGMGERTMWRGRSQTKKG